VLSNPTCENALSIGWSAEVEPAHLSVVIIMIRFGAAAVKLNSTAQLSQPH
jgi:hypothetical protein